MIYLFYGADRFSLLGALQEVRQALGPPEVWDANTTRLEPQGLTPEALLGHCQTVPFLASRRLVVVEGLLSRFEPSREGEAPSLPGPWKGVAQTLKGIPETTDLVFLDGPLSERNPLLRELVPVAQVRAFTPLRGADLRRWVRERAEAKGLRLSAPAVDLLVGLVGPDLGVLDGELEKLSLYAGERLVEREDVETLVGGAREVNIFSAVDAVMERDAPRALHLLHRLLASGEEPLHLLALLGRQVRHLLLAQDLVRQGLGPEAVGGRLGLAGYSLRKTLEQAERCPRDLLLRLHRHLRETDHAIKRGALKADLAVEALVAEACLPPLSPGGR